MSTSEPNPKDSKLIIDKRLDPDIAKASLRDRDENGEPTRKQKVRIHHYDYHEKKTLVVEFRTMLIADQLNAALFFKECIKAYLKRDPRLLEIVIPHSKIENKKAHLEASARLYQAAKQKTKSLETALDLSDEERTELFDVIEQEHPEL